MFKDESIEFLDAGYPIVNKFIILSSIVAVFGIEIALLKFNIISNLLEVGKKEKFVRSLLLFFVGAAGFLALFQSGPIGVYLIAAIYLSSSFFRDDQRSYAGMALLVFTMIPYVMSLGEGNLAMDKADVLLGLFLGAFSALFMHNQSKTNLTWFNIIITHLLVLTFSTVVFVLHTVYANMGGVDAYSSFLLGLVITGAVVGNGVIAMSVIPFSLAITLMIAPHMVNEEQNEFESLFEEFDGLDKDSVSDTLQTLDIEIEESDSLIIEEETIEEPQNEFAFASLIGKHSFVSGNSKVLFELGEDGETKGAFKKLEGGVTIDEDPGKWKLNVELSMTDFTTFDEMRDGHLNGEEYFHVDKFPKMTYKANKVIQSGSEWFFNGQFTMLGVSKELKVSVSSSVKDGKNYIVGKGVIDRREFGMTPSETEGNIVSFNYIAEIK
jgi:polyisoprenoid-binding protein YceI